LNVPTVVLYKSYETVSSGSKFSANLNLLHSKGLSSLYRRHVFYDLQPFSCTFEKCASTLFSNRHTWFDHELKVHRKQWNCISCQHSPFDSADKFEKHLSRRHANVLTKDQIPFIINACETPLDRFRASSCPLCSDWKLFFSTPGHSPSDLFATVEQFRKHLGRHLEQLALFALPIAVGGDQNDELGSNDVIVEHSDVSSSSDSDNTFHEETVVERMWQPLFDSKKRPTVRLGQFLRGIALFLVNCNLILHCDAVAYCHNRSKSSILKKVWS
jgi:hypothetical protein